MAQTLPRVEQRVADLVEQHRPELERLVRDHVDRLLGELIDTELASRNNGNTAATEAPRPTAVGTQTKVCTSCRQEKPLAQFEKHRATCRECRRQRARENADRRAERATQADDEGPRPGPTAQTD